MGDRWVGTLRLAALVLYRAGALAQRLGRLSTSQALDDLGVKLLETAWWVDSKATALAVRRRIS